MPDTPDDVVGIVPRQLEPDSEEPNVAQLYGELLAVPELGADVVGGVGYCSAIRLVTIHVKRPLSAPEVAALDAALARHTPA